MGIGTIMVTGTFFISAGFGVVVSLFILPAVAYAAIELAKVVAALNDAKAEIASYGDYKNEYDSLIEKIEELQTNVNSTKDSSGLIKNELNEVCAPWSALKQDLEEIKAKIENESIDNYEQMKTSFEEILTKITVLESYVGKLELRKDILKVVQADELEADANYLMDKANEKGISLDEFMAAS